MRGGALRFLVILERRVNEQQPSGGLTYDYAEFDQDYASIEDLVGRELASADQVQAQGTTRIRLRHRDDVDETCRIRHVTDESTSPVTQDIYDIVAPPMVDMRTGRRELILMCSKLRAEGWRRGSG